MAELPPNTRPVNAFGQPLAPTPPPAPPPVSAPSPTPTATAAAAPRPPAPAPATGMNPALFQSKELQRIHAPQIRQQAAAQKDQARQLAQIQKDNERAAKEAADRQKRDLNNQREAEFRSTGRPSYVDADGIIQPTQDDATWQASQLQQQQEAQKQVEWKKAGRTTWKNPVSGKIEPLEDDATFAQKQAEAAAKRAEDLRRKVIDDELTKTTVLASDPSRARLTSTDRSKIEKDLQTAQEAARAALITRHSTNAKAVTGGDDWIPFNESPSPEAQTSKTRLEKLQSTFDTPLDDDDLADLEADETTAPAAAQIRSLKEKLASDDENATWQQSQAERVFDLKLKRENPQAWAERRAQRLATLSPTDHAKALEAEAGDFVTRVAEHEAQAAPLIQQQTAFQNELTTLETQAAEARQRGIPAGELVTLTGPDGTAQDWPEALAETYLRKAQEADTWQTQNRDTLDLIQTRQTALQQEQEAITTSENERVQKAKAERQAQLQKLTANPLTRPLGEGMTALDTEAEQRRAALDAKFPDPASPQAQEARAALDADIEAKATALEDQVRQRQQTVQEAYAEITAQRTANPDETNIGQYFVTARQKLVDTLGVTPKEADVMLDDQLKLDWTLSNVPDRSAVKAITEGGNKEPTRILSSGDILVNPDLLPTEKAARAAIESAPASKEAKARAIAALPALRQNWAQQMLPAFTDKQTPFFLDFNEWRQGSILSKGKLEDGGAFARQTPAEQLLAYLDERGNDSPAVKMGRHIATGLYAGLMDLTTQGLSAASLLWSATPIDYLAGGAISQGLAELAVANQENSQAVSMTAAYDQAGLLTRGLGQGARILPSLAPSLAGGAAAQAGLAMAARTAIGARALTGLMAATKAKDAKTALSLVQTQIGVAGAGAAGGVQTTGAQYADIYGDLRAKGLDHKAAHRAAVMPALLSGAATAILTTAFGATGAEALLKQGAQQAVKNRFTAVMKGLLKGAVAEQPEEIVDEMISHVIADVSKNPGKDIHRSIGEFLETVPELAIAIGVMGGAGGAAAAFRQPGAPKTNPATGPEPVLPEEVAAARTAVANYQPAPGSPLTKEAAAAALRVARGEFSKLTTAELNSLGWTRENGQYKPLKDYAGPPALEFTDKEQTTPILRQELLDQIDATLPELGDAIAMDEAEAREFFQQKAAAAAEETDGAPAASAAPPPAAADPAATPADLPPVVEQTPSATNPVNPSENPVNPVQSPAEAERTEQLTNHLSALGLPQDQAEKVAAHMVRVQGVIGEDYRFNVVADSFKAELKKLGISGALDRAKARENPLKAPADLDARLSQAVPPVAVAAPANAPAVEATPEPRGSSAQGAAAPAVSGVDTPQGGAEVTPTEAPPAPAPVSRHSPNSRAGKLAAMLVADGSYTQQEADDALDDYMAARPKGTEKMTPIEEKKPLLKFLAARENQQNGGRLKRATATATADSTTAPTLEAAQAAAVASQPVGSRRRARRAMVAMNQALAQWGKAFDRIDYSPAARQRLEGAGMAVDTAADGKIVLLVDLEEFAKQHSWSARSRLLSADTLSEEIIHALAKALARKDKAFSDAEMAKLWDDLTPKLRQTVWDAYNARALSDDPDFPSAPPAETPQDIKAALSHEFLRMLVQQKAFTKRVTEEFGIDQRGLLPRIAALLKKLANALQDAIKGAPKDLQTRLGAYESKLLAAAQALEAAAPTGKDSLPVQNPVNPVTPVKSAVTTDDNRSPVVIAGSPAPSASGPASLTTGSTGTAYTDTNDAIDYEWAVVETGDLTISNRDDGTVDPAYPQELQPRDRTSAGSESQVQDIAKNANLDRLSASNTVGDGAPIIGPDGVVESGNGRTMGIRRAYTRGMDSAAAYKQRLTETAASYGLDPAKVASMKAPMLVRVRTTNVDRGAFVMAANVSTIAPKREIEQAKSDAKQIVPDLFETFVATEDGDIFTAANAEFIRGFIAGVIPPAERPAIYDAKGFLSQTGLRRLRNALFVYAYGDSKSTLNALARLTEDIEADGRNLINALVALAPKFGEQNARIAAGALRPLSITQDLAESLAAYQGIKERGETVENWAAQTTLPGVDDGPTDLQKALVTTLHENRRSARKLMAVLNRYAAGIESLGDPKQASLFGDEPTPTQLELWNVAATAEPTGPTLAMAAKTSPTGTLAPPNALKLYRKLKQIERENGTLSGTQAQTLQRAERALGQSFFPFAEPIAPVDFSLETEIAWTSKPSQAEQLALFAAQKTPSAKIRAAFPDWSYGFDAYGLPNPPRTLPADSPLLEPTDKKKIAVLPSDHPLVKAGMLPANQEVPRKVFRRALEAYFFRDKTPVPAGTRPVAFASGGGGGAGKSTIIRLLNDKGDIDTKNAVMVNADDIKELIPEYNQIARAGDGRAAAVVHEESSHMAASLLNRILTASENRYNFVFDATLANGEGSLKKIAQWQAAGFHVHLIGVTVDPQEAMERAAIRGLESGRWVPNPMLDAAHKGFNANIKAYLDVVDSADLFDNTPPNPHQIAYKTDAKTPISVVNQEFWSIIDRRHQDERSRDSESGAEEVGSEFAGSQSRREGLGETALREVQSPREGSRSQDSRLAAARKTRDAGPSLFSFDFTSTNTPSTAAPDLGFTSLLTPAQREAKLQAAEQLDLFGGTPNARPRPTSQRPPQPARSPRTPGDAETTQSPDDLFGNAGMAGTGGRGGIGTGTGLTGGSGSSGNNADGGQTTGGVGTDTPGEDDAQSLLDGDSTDGSTTPASDVVSDPYDFIAALRPEAGTPARNFEPAEDLTSLAPATDRAKILANIEAIDLLKRLEAENRNATPEEKAKLAAYTGWGAFKEAFNSKYENDIATHWDSQPEWKKEQYMPDWLQSWEKNHRPLHRLLREKMSDEEFNAASRSTLNAHYTAAPYIRAMWKMVERLGFNGGRALEPSAGNGHYIGLQPRNLANRTEWQGVELDDLSARLLAKLYPEVTVNELLADPTGSRQITGLGFERARIPNGSIDLVISNVPFHSSGPGKKGFPTLNLHNFFFAHALDKVKPGGLVAFITSESTMQNNPRQREFIASKGDLVAAYRLPNNAFKGNAGTEVTTDIIIFRKPDGKPFTPLAWQNLVEVGRQTITITQSADQAADEFRAEAARTGTLVGKEYRKNGKLAQDVSAPIMVNEYFVANPTHVLGTHTLSGSMYSAGQYAVVAPDNMDVAAALESLIPSLPENILGPQSTTERIDVKLADKSDKPYSFKEVDGVIYEVQPDGSMLPAEWWKNPFTEEFQAYDAAAGERITAANLAKWEKQTAERRKEGKKPLKQPQSEADKFNDQIKIWRSWKRVSNAIEDLVKAENRPTVTEAQLDTLRRELNIAYDTHVSKYSPISRRFANEHRHLRGDPSYYLTAALETEAVTLDKKTGKKIYSYRKADIFRQRIITPVSEPTKARNIIEAIDVSLAWRGAIDRVYGASLLKITPAQFEAQALEQPNVFKHHSSGQLQTAEEYLTGNVRTKLAAAEEAAKDSPELGRNVEALRAVQPERRNIGTIAPTLGARWIPAPVYNAFIRDILTGADTVQYTAVANAWTFTGPHLFRSEEFGTDSKGAYSLMKHALDMTDPIVYDGRGDDRTVNHEKTAAARARLGKMKQAFIAYVKTSETQVSIDGQEKPVWLAAEDAYNESKNSYVTPAHKGTFLTFPGLNTDYVYTRPHRRAVIARFLADRRGMMAHGVGSGKTFNQIILSYEMRRLGLAKKPMIVVQNATLSQFAASYLQAYPSAKILVPTKTDFQDGNRKKLVAKIATGDWDAVILPHSQFDLIANKEQSIRNYLGNQIAELRELITRERDKAKVKDLEGTLKKLEDRLQSMLDKLRTRQDDVVFWEDLGVDSIILDEAHNYKSLPIVTRMGRVKGVPSSTDSQRAISFMLKARDVQAKTGGKNIFLATGTPIKNSMAEAYIMLDFMAPDILADFGIQNFDDFATAYGQMESNPEMSWSGTPRMENRFAKFQNGRDLVTMIRTVFDVAMGNEALGLDVPAIEGGEPQMVIVDKTPTNELFNRWVRNVGELWKNASGQDKEEFGAVPIQTMAAGIAAALDPRLISPNAPDHPESKVNTSVRNILEIYKQGAERKTTQLVFSDLRNPFSMDYMLPFTGHPFPEYDGEGTFDLYEDIKKKLIAGGIPEKEIHLMKSGMKDAAKKALFDKVNSGEVRVVIGSTELLGVGVNVQQRLKAIHNLMPPRDFTPAMMEQRIGRIIRQGNMHAAKVDGQPAWNEPVRILNYGTDGSMDSAIYGTLARKQRFITQLLMGENTQDSFDDPTDPVAVNLAEMAARTLGDPDFIRRIELEKEVKELRLLRDAFVSEQSSRRSRLRSAEGYVDAAPRMIELEERRLAELKDVWKRKAPRPENVREETDISDKAVYEFGNQTVDTATKDGAITNKLDLWLLDASKTMERRGRKEDTTTLAINGKTFMVTVQTTMDGSPTPGTVNVEGRSIRFNGAASLITQLRYAADSVQSEINQIRLIARDYEQSITRLRATLEAESEFPDADRLDAIEQEIVEVDARLAAKAAPTPTTPATTDSQEDLTLPPLKKPDPKFMTAAVVIALENADIIGNKLFLPDQLDRKLYEAVNKALESAGGTWNKKAKAHVFRSNPSVVLGLKPDLSLLLANYRSSLDAYYGTAPTYYPAMPLAMARKTAPVDDSDIQGYLDLDNVAIPSSKQPAAKRAIRAAEAASTAPYPLPDARGSDRNRDRLKGLRESAQRAWRGLTGLNPEAIAEAFKQSDTISSLLHDFIRQDIPSFDIRGAIIESPADFAAFNLAVRSPYFEALKIAVIGDGNQVIHSQILSVGSLNETIADPKRIAAVIAAARVANPKQNIAGYLIAHNHPSGNPTPSDADRRMTRRFEEVGALLGVPLMDHVVTNGTRYVSFREYGLMQSPTMPVELAAPSRSLKPKLPILPTPARPGEYNLADWEVVPSSDPDAERPLANDPGLLNKLISNLATGDPGHLHAIYVDTQLRVRAVERIPETASPAKIIQTLIQGAAREGAYALSLGKSHSSNDPTPSDATRRIHRSVREAVQTAALQFLDTLITTPSGAYFSFAENGMAEEPATYSTSPLAAAPKVSDTPTDENPSRLAQGPTPRTRITGRSLTPEQGQAVSDGWKTLLQSALREGDANWQAPDLAQRLAETFGVPVLSATEESAIRELPVNTDGIESKVYLDRQNGVIYKRLATGTDEPSAGIWPTLAYTPDGKLDWEFNQATRARHLGLRIGVMTAIGGTPTEIHGIGQDGHIYLTQPLSPNPGIGRDPDALDNNALTIARRRAGIVEIPGGMIARGTLFRAHVVAVNSRPWFITDLHPDNFIGDTQGNARINDPVIGQIPADLIAKVPGLASVVKQALQEEKRLGDRSARLFMAQKTAAPVEPGFYSQLAETLRAKMPARAGKDQITSIIKGGGKAEEVKWSGILPWVDAQTGPIEREAVLAYLAAEGAVRFEEVTMGGRLGDRYDPELVRQIDEVTRQMRIYREDAANVYGEDRGKWPAEVHNGPEITRLKNEHTRLIRQRDDKAEVTAPKFSQYQLPGGENYREVVLSMLPQEKGSIKSATPNPDGGFDVEFTNGETGLFESIEEAKADGGTGSGIENKYTSSHFPDVPNYVAHMRTNERTDAEGNPGLFLEELQSDRHQAGREKGYKSDELTEAEVIAERIVQVPETAGEYAGQWAFRNDEGRYEGVRKTKEQAIEANAKALLQARMLPSVGAVADAPFRSTWPLALFKRALRDAVAGGKEWIGWTTGQTQADRYDLSKQVDEIRADRRSTGTDIIVFKDGSKLVERQDLTDSELADLIGKEMAEKITNQRALTHTYSGLDLKVGGAGMKGFYDNILPKEIGKYVKQWGGTVATAELRSDGQNFSLNPDGSQNDYRAPAITPIWRVNITPAMREGVQRGQPLFAAPKTLDTAAHTAATSPQNATPQPTDAQKRAGNYKVGRVQVGPLDISIENPAGSTRSGTDPNGKAWSITMLDHYGYVRGTQGKDGDHIDIFIEPGTPTDYTGPVFVVNQTDTQGNFDEHKAVMGPSVQSEAAARAEYLQNYSPGWKGAGTIARFESVQAFADWAAARRRIAPAKPLPAAPKTNPLAQLGWNHLDKALSAKLAAHTRWMNEKTGAGETVAAWLQADKVKPFAALGKVIQRELFPDSVLPREITARMREMNVKSAMGAQRAMDLTRALSGTPKFSDIVYPPSFTENPIHRRHLYEAMAGMRDMASLPQELQDLATRLRKMLVEIGQEAVKQGRMSLDTFEGLRENYMPHFYEEDVAREKSFIKRFALGVKDIFAQRTTAWHVVDTKTKDKTGEPRIVSYDGNRWRFKNKEHRDAWFEDFIAKESLDRLQSRDKRWRSLTLADLNKRSALPDEARGRLQEIENSLRAQYRKEKPLSLSEQEKAGLILDPVYSIARYAAQMVHDNSTAEFFNFVASKPEWISDTATPGFTQVPDNTAFGRLAGKYVENDIHRQLTEMVEAPNAALRLYDTILSWWKTGKTVLNPGTHVRNVLGNIPFATFAGVNPLNPGNMGFYRDSLRHLRNGGQTLTEAYEDGVLGADFVSAELRQTLRQLLPDPATIEESDRGESILLGIGKAIGQVLPHWAKNPAHKAYNQIAALYQVEDEIYKMAAYLKARNMGMSREEAAAHVRHWFPYYDLAASATLKLAQRTGMPFLSFYRESIRIFGHALTERPLALATTLAIPSIITALSAMALGLDDDDLEQIRKDMRGKAGKLLGPTPIGGMPLFSMLLPFRSANGDFQQFDISAIHPFADHLGNRVETDKTEDWWQQTWRSMLTAGPIGNLVYAQVTGRDAFGDRPFVEDNMTAGEKLAARLDNAAKTALPPLTPFVGTGFQTIANAGERSTNKTLELRSPTQAVLRAVVGLDVRNANPDIYRIAEDWRKANNIPTTEGMDFSATTPTSRARKALFAELARPEPNLKAIKNLTDFLDKTGSPVKTADDVRKLLFYRNPLMVIRGRENQQRFRASLTGQERTVLETALSEFDKIQSRAPSLILQARAQ